MPKRKIKQLLFESFLVTILVFAVVWLLFISLRISFKPLNDFISKSLKDVHLSDVFFSTIQVPRVDTAIVIINIGELDRSGIAHLAEKVLQYNPSVIGIDVLFAAERKDEAGDSLLNSVLTNYADKIVIGGFYKVDSMVFNREYKQFNASNIGHINLLTDSLRINVVRNCYLWYQHETHPINSFALEIIRIADSLKYDLAKSRKENVTLINYRGNKDAFRILNGQEVLDFNRDFQREIAGKIVLLGYCGSGMGNRLDDLDDMFYTPLNDKLHVRSHPDMYGVVIHANIISMILSADYINSIRGLMAKGLSFILVWMHVIAFAFFFIKRHLWYHIAAKLIQLISLVLIMWTVIYLLDVHRVMMDLRYIFLGVFISVDVLYLYEVLAVLLNKKTGIRSIFIQPQEVKGIET